MSTSRRTFLADFGRLAGAAPLLGALGERVSARVASSAVANAGLDQTPFRKAVLTAQDFVYRGAFQMPTAVGSGDPPWGTGLAHRYVNGELRYFAKAHPSTVYEVAAPSLTADPRRASPAKLVRTWGDIVGPDSYGSSLGLYWDEPDHRLYWSAGSSYNTSAPRDPSIGFCTLDDRTGASQRAGIWGFVDRSCKMALGGVTPIPRWFSDACCPGRRLGAGFGGSFAILATGPASMGPALTAFDPRDLATVPSRRSVENTPLVGYPFNANPDTPPDRAHRDTDYRTDFDGWNPKGGVGYWSWSDYLWQGGVWVDTPTKTGLLFCPTMSNGRTWYERSTLNAERASHWWYVYDPSDLASVARKEREQWQIQALHGWPIKYPGIDYPMSGWANEPARHVVGVTFDAVTARLSVAVRFALEYRTGSPIVVYVYEVV
jgi:hypothetical protein